MKVTIICPTYNSAKLLPRSLQSWVNFNFPKEDYEILICDRNSEDKTKEIVEEFSKFNSNVYYVLSQPRTSTQRNTGIEHAKANIIVFFDDDSYAEPAHLKKGLEFLQDHPDYDIIGGPQVDSPEDKFFAKAAGAAMSSLFGSFIIAKRYKKMKQTLDADEFYLTSANVFIRKKVFDKIGSFDETLYPGEDPEFFARAKKNSIKMAFDPALAVQHSRRPNLKAFCKQHFKYGQTRVLKEKITKTPFPQNLMFITPPLFLIYILLLPVLSQINKILLWPAILYVALAIIFAFPAALYKKIPFAILLIPLLFFSMHVSYGAGFLYSLIKTKL